MKPTKNDLLCKKYNTEWNMHMDWCFNS